MTPDTAHLQMLTLSCPLMRQRALAYRGSTGGPLGHVVLCSRVNGFLQVPVVLTLECAVHC